MNETQVSQLPVYAGNDLGAVWRSSATAFRLWAPTAVSYTHLTLPTKA